MRPALAAMGSFGAAAPPWPAGASGARASSSRTPAAAIFKNSRALSLRAMVSPPCKVFAAPRAAAPPGGLHAYRARYSGNVTAILRLILRGDEGQLHHLL